MTQIPNIKQARAKFQAFFGAWNFDFGIFNVNPRRGFTLTEIIIVVSILAVLSTIVTVSLSRYSRTQALLGTVRAIASELEDARNRTLSSKDSSQYGVHFESDAIALFKGDAYSASDPENEETAIDSRVTISTITLSGGAVDIVFERLSGEAESYGTIEVSASTDTNINRTITIQETGLVSFN